MNKIELLAPAGTMEKMKMALLYGADAYYLAEKVVGLRAYWAAPLLSSVAKFPQYARRPTTFPA